MWRGGGVVAAGAFDGAVDGGAGDVEQGGELGGGVLAGRVELNEVFLLGAPGLPKLSPAAR